MAEEYRLDPSKPFAAHRRVEAADALARLVEVDAARRILRESARDPDPDVRKLAEKIWQEIGADPRTGPAGGMIPK